jgi:hypothetical protein
MKVLSESWTNEEVPLSRIDWEDRAFRMTYHRPLTTLTCSIGSIGLQNSPVLQKKEGGLFRIVSGFRRLQVLAMGGQGVVCCRTAPVEAGEKELLFFNFQDNLDRGFNPVEQSWVLNRLSCFMEKGALIQEILPLMGLPPKQEILDRCFKIAQISPVFWPFLLEGRLFPEIIQELVDEYRPLDALILALFILFRWSFQKQKEFLRALKEISHRKGESPEVILHSTPITRILSVIEGTPQQKGEEIRRYFRNRLYPVLTETENIFSTHLAGLDLDRRTQLVPPPFFEGGIYQLEIKFSGPEELKSSLERISRAVSMGKLNDLP